MVIERLPASVTTLYAELLELATHAQAERLAAGLPRGSFVAKDIKGHRYWYLQVAQGTSKQQRYLGAESPALLAWMRQAREARAGLAEDDRLRASLVAMLASGGAARQQAAVVRVLELLADLGVFRRGGVLIGTHAFQVYGNLLGVRFEKQSMRTEDIDIGHDRSLALALSDEPPASVGASLVGAGLGFLPVPELDPRLPSTSFKVRGRELRVDFLTTARSASQTAPVRVPALGISAQPLPFLDYLIEETTPAVVVGGSGVLVQVPVPARFAFHKLWTARRRPASEQARSSKDRHQATALLTLLAEERPEDLAPAWEALRERKSARRIVESELRRLPAELKERLLSTAIRDPVES